MKFFADMKARRTWRYIGTVEGVTRLVKDDGSYVNGGEKRTYWILTERGDGKRAAKQTGSDPTYGSAGCLEAQAHVSAWLCGGPLPELSDKFRNRPRGHLVAFKGGAA